MGVGAAAWSGAPTWRYATAAARTATIQASDPTVATMPGSPTITLFPQALNRVRHGGTLSQGRVVAVLYERADCEPDHALVGGVEEHERADREPADPCGPTRQVAHQQRESQAEQPDEDERPCMDDLVRHHVVAQIGVDVVGVDVRVEPQQHRPREWHPDRERE